jgi:hypothetical protein
MTNLIQQKDFWNPLHINGLHEIDAIHIYKNNQVLASFRWLSIIGGNNDYPLLSIDADIKRANKVDMTKNAFFYVRTQKSYSSDKVYDVYMPAELVQFKAGKEVIDWKDKTTVCYKRNYSITLTRYQKKEHAYDKKEDKHSVAIVDHYGVLDFTLYSRTIETPLGKNCVQLSKEIKEKCGVELSSYDIEKILYRYVITKKHS